MSDAYIKEIGMEYFMRTPAGQNIQNAIQIWEKVQENCIALLQQGDDPQYLVLKLGNGIAFSVLRQIGEGKNPIHFSRDDWKKVAEEVSDTAILGDDQAYAKFIFGMYEKYIRFSAAAMRGIISDDNADKIAALADELNEKGALLDSGEIKEVSYIEDCLWICLEAMIKLLASTAIHIPVLYAEGAAEALNIDASVLASMDLQWIENFSVAISSFAFEYGRYRLWANEQADLLEYLRHQDKLDAELNEKYAHFEQELNADIQQFYELMENAFTSNFRESFLYSIKLAREAGVAEEEILKTTEDIDAFFMN